MLITISCHVEKCNPHLLFPRLAICKEVWYIFSKRVSGRNKGKLLEKVGRKAVSLTLAKPGKAVWLPSKGREMIHCIFILLCLIFLAPSVWANSMSFQLTVTLPSHVTSASSSSTADSITQPKKSDQVIQMEQLTRNNKLVQVTSIVAR